MEENKYDILIECGADFVLPFTWYDNNGNPYNLTGATIEAQLRETSSSSDYFDIICTHNGKGGRITLTIPNEVTSEIPYSYGVYDVYVNMADGSRKRPLFGDVKIQDHVTRPLNGTGLFMVGIGERADLPIPGSISRLYLVYEDNLVYRWNGSNYISIGHHSEDEHRCNVVIFDTIADVSNVAGFLKPGSFVETNGYYASGDEGGARYKVLSVYDSNKPWLINIGQNRFLEIVETDRVTYRMFGAKLDGVTDDGTAIKNCHDYANKIKFKESNGRTYYYPCRVENHRGIIYKKNSVPIYAYTDVDLSGSTLVMDDYNSAWFGFYVWGNNNSSIYTFDIGDNLLSCMKKDNARLKFDYKMVAPPNTVLYFDESSYAMRNNGGDYYSVERMELMVHLQDGWCVSPFCDDWGSDGADLFSVELSESSATNVYGIKQVWYNYIPTKHGHFVGCRVKYKCSGPNLTSAVVWVRRHNATVSDFIFEPNLNNLQNTLYKNASIYVYGCYDVTLRNIIGLNNAGKRLSNNNNATSGYVIRIFGCDTINIENCDLSGFWGAVAASQVKNLTIRDTKSNRLDVHDGVYNILIDNCVLYTHAIQVGYGRGNLTVQNCKFYFSYSTDDCYQALYMVALQATYGRIFSGKIHVRNCEAFCYTNPNEVAHNYRIVKVEFDDVSQSLLPYYEYPELNIESVNIWSNDPEHTNIWYAYVAGTRTAKSGYVAPSLAPNQLIDNTALWLYLDRTYDFMNNDDTVDERTALTAGTFIRKITTMSGNEGTIVLDVQYFEVVVGGAIAETVPTNTTGNNFTWGGCTLRYKQAEDVEWHSNHNYSVNALCVSSFSVYKRGYCFKCVTAGKSNGTAPVHTSGTAQDVPGENLEPITWTFIKTLGTGEYIKYAPGLTVTTGQWMEYNGGLVYIVSGGVLSNTLPKLSWFEDVSCGTAILQFAGVKWEPHKWVPQNGYCVNEGRLYRNLGGTEGTTSGKLLQKPSGNLIDGKIIWHILSETPSEYENWSARTEYSIGDAVKIGDNYYECVFNGRLALPEKFYFGDIKTNAANQYGWVFDTGTSVATIEKGGDIVTKFLDCNLTSPMLNNSGSTKPFGKDDNPDITSYVRTPEEVVELDARLTVLENTAYKYYAKLELPYEGATARTRVMLPYDTVAGVYRVSESCQVTAGTAAGVSVSDNTVSGTIAANSSAYIKMPSGDASSSAGKQIIFAVYPGSSNYGTITITIERTNVTDDVTDIDIDFS